MRKERKNSFVTLFNSLYLSRGLCLYHSLNRCAKSFVLYVIAFDDFTEKKLMELDLDNMVVIPLKDMEETDEALLKSKENRSMTEYCWTCSSKSILYVMERYSLDICTYLDADTYFFSDPQVLLEEIAEKDIIITSHRYSGYCNQTERSGKYCVQFVSAKNTENGRSIIQWWYERCLEWCYFRYEDGKLGDQMYLDHFHELFEGVHDLENEGAGVAPWNVDQYSFQKIGENIYYDKIDSNIKGNPLIFYHFHGLEFFDKNVVHLAPNMYRIPDTAISHVYKEYIRENNRICNEYLMDNIEVNYTNAKHFRDDNIDFLSHAKHYYNKTLFI